MLQLKHKLHERIKGIFQSCSKDVITQINIKMLSEYQHKSNLRK